MATRDPGQQNQKEEKPRQSTVDWAQQNIAGINAGAQTGVPANSVSNSVATRYDSTNHKLWIYDGGWKSVTFS